MLSLLAAMAVMTGPVEPWTPEGVSSPMFESHAAFDPRNGDLYFVRSDTTFSGWRILTSHCTAAGWTKPVDAPFAGDGVEGSEPRRVHMESLYGSHRDYEFDLCPSSGEDRFPIPRPR